MVFFIVRCADEAHDCKDFVGINALDHTQRTVIFNVFERIPGQLCDASVSEIHCVFCFYSKFKDISSKLYEHMKVSPGLVKFGDIHYLRNCSGPRPFDLVDTSGSHAFERIKSIDIYYIGGWGLVDDLKRMLADAQTHDVMLVMNARTSTQIEISAHKSILAARSDKFRAMFFGRIVNDAKRVELGTIATEKTYKTFFEYIYTSIYSSTDLSCMQQLEILGLAEEYLVSHLKDECVKQLIETLALITTVRDLDFYMLFMDVKKISPLVYNAFLKLLASHLVVLTTNQKTYDFMITQPQLLMDMVMSTDEKNTFHIFENEQDNSVSNKRMKTNALEDTALEELLHLTE